MSSIATTKTELINAIQTSYQKLRTEIDSIPLDMSEEKSMEGQIKNTKMSFNNLLSYLVGWGELVLKWNTIYTTERRIPDLPDTGYTMSDWGKLAERFYKEYEDQDFKKLTKQLDAVVARIITMIESKTDKELYGAPWYVTKSSAKRYPFGRLVQLNTASPYKNAHGRIRKWKKDKAVL